jgi:hypothetical protein
MKTLNLKTSFVRTMFLLFLVFFAYTDTYSIKAEGPILINIDPASSVASGDTVDLNIKIDSTGSLRQPTGLQWDFVYNKSDINSIVWKSNGPSVVSAGKSVTCSTVSDNIFRCLVVGFNSNTISSGNVGVFTVTLKSSSSTTYIPISFSNIIVSDANNQSIPVVGNQATITKSVSVPTLSATCSPNVTSGSIMNTITWSAYPSGGDGTYRYAWSGSENLNGSGSSASIFYATQGSKTASVQVFSGNQQITVSCSPSVTINPPTVTGSCAVSVVPVNNNEYDISWSALLNANFSTTTYYTWSGSDGLSSSNPYITKRYNSVGLKRGDITIQSGDQQFTLNCSADTSKIFSASNSSPLGGNCSTSVSGMNITWKSYANGGGSQTPTFQWATTDGFSTTTSVASFIYPSEGIKAGTVSVQSGNSVLAMTCQAKISPVITNSGCFIATAAFGTALEPRINVLRNFRDNELIKTEAGSMLVDTYYKISPPIANVIRQHESLKALVRVGLEPVIFVLDHAGYNE